VYFTLAVSAATAARCAALAGAARDADPRVMPVPGPARVAWRAPDGRAAVLHWGTPGSADPPSAGTAYAGTIWAEGAEVRARTGRTRVDPVYLAEVPGAVVVSDRASWTAAATGRLRDPDPVMIGAFLSLGYPLGGATPFRGVRALDGDRRLRAAAGQLTVTRVARGRPAEGPGGAGPVAEALTEAVRPLGEGAAPVRLSLTGGAGLQPQLAGPGIRVAVGLERRGLPGHEDRAPGRVVGFRARRVLPERGHDGVPGQRDVHRSRVEGQHVLGPQRQRGGQRGDAVHDAAEVAPDPQQERDQLADVLRARAQPGHDQRGAHVERRLHQQRRHQQQPVPGERLPGPQHDGEHHDHRQQQLLELHDHVGQRQAGPREMKRADQRDIRPDHRRADHNRPLGKGEYEHSDNQVCRVIADAAVRLEQDPEDEVVHRRVEQRREDLPELAEPRLGVHRHVAGRGVRDDEVPPLPDFAQVSTQERPFGGGPQAVPGREGGQRLTRRARHRGTGLVSGPGREFVLQAARCNQPPAVPHGCGFYGGRRPRKRVSAAGGKPFARSSARINPPYP
jgi:hypothetical protein